MKAAGLVGALNHQEPVKSISVPNALKGLKYQIAELVSCIRIGATCILVQKATNEFSFIGIGGIQKLFVLS